MFSAVMVGLGLGRPQGPAVYMQNMVLAPVYKAQVAIKLIAICGVFAYQMRMGITTYLKFWLSGRVTRAELLPSASAICTMSCSMLARASMR